MANTTRFVFENVLVGKTLQNGTGALNAPARVQDAAFPMENAYDRDRSIVWATGAAPATPQKFDVDLGADTAIRFAGALNIRGGVTSWREDYETAGGGYNGADGGGWVTASSTLSAKRNVGEVLPGGPITGRYWRARLVNSSAFALKLWLATTVVDTGVIHTPGGGETFVHPRTERETPEGTRFIFVHGIPYKRFSLPFGVVSASLYAQLLQAIVEQRSFLYIAWDDAVYEVVVAPETAAILLMVADPSIPLRNVTLNLEEQP